MKTFLLVISSPDGDVFRGEVAGLSVRGVEGELAVLAGHIPFITSVKECNPKITLEDGTERIGHTEGGLLTVSTDSVTLLTGSFKWIEE